MPFTELSAGQAQHYQDHGYVVLKKLFLQEEIDKVYHAALNDAIMQKNAIDLNDGSGKKTKLSLWFTPGNDVFGYLCRNSRMIDSVSRLLGVQSKVCHFHSKLMQKEPKVGGAWEWHQDYGYWYKNQFMFPDQMISVMVALTPANKKNGCLQVIKGSHKLGRVNHGFAGEQVGADLIMVENALKTMDLIYVELDAGDALFFHANLLHRSEANLSDYPRWSIISCYNLESNLAYNEKSRSWQTPVDIVPDEAILEWATKDSPEGDFLRKEDDPALKKEVWGENKS